MIWWWRGWIRPACGGRFSVSEVFRSGSLSIFFLFFFFLHAKSKRIWTHTSVGRAHHVRGAPRVNLAGIFEKKHYIFDLKFFFFNFSCCSFFGFGFEFAMSVQNWFKIAWTPWTISEVLKGGSLKGISLRSPNAQMGIPTMFHQNPHHLSKYNMCPGYHQSLSKAFAKASQKPCQASPKLRQASMTFGCKFWRKFCGEFKCEFGRKFSCEYCCEFCREVCREVCWNVAAKIATNLAANLAPNVAPNFAPNFFPDFFWKPKWRESLLKIFGSKFGEKFGSEVER